MMRGVQLSNILTQLILPVHIGANLGQLPFVYIKVLLVPPSAKYHPGGQMYVAMSQFSLLTTTSALELGGAGCGHSEGGPTMKHHQQQKLTDKKN